MNNILNNFDTARFVDNLHYMWEGMLSIFIVIGVIILSVYALSFFSKKFGRKKKEIDK